jgi:hypothetical protein
VEGHQAAHGRFDTRSSADSSEFWVNTHRTALLAAGAAGAAGGLAGVIASRHLRDHNEEM